MKLEGKDGKIVINGTSAPIVEWDIDITFPTTPKPWYKRAARRAMSLVDYWWDWLSRGVKAWIRSWYKL